MPCAAAIAAPFRNYIHMLILTLLDVGTTCKLAARMAGYGITWDPACCRWSDGRDVNVNLFVVTVICCAGDVQASQHVSSTLLGCQLPALGTGDNCLHGGHAHKAYSAVIIETL